MKLEKNTAMELDFGQLYSRKRWNFPYELRWGRPSVCKPFSYCLFRVFPLGSSKACMCSCSCLVPGLSWGHWWIFISLASFSSIWHTSWTNIGNSHFYWIWSILLRFFHLSQTAVFVKCLFVLWSILYLSHSWFLLFMERGSNFQFTTAWLCRETAISSFLGGWSALPYYWC